MRTAVARCAAVAISIARCSAWSVDALADPSYLSCSVNEQCLACPDPVALWDARWIDLASFQSISQLAKMLSRAAKLPPRGFARAVFARFPDVRSRLCTLELTSEILFFTLVWTSMHALLNCNCTEEEVAFTIVRRTYMNMPRSVPVAALVWALEAPASVLELLIKSYIKKHDNNSLRELLACKNYDLTAIFLKCLNDIESEGRTSLERIADLYNLCKHFLHLMRPPGDVIRHALQHGRMCTAINGLHDDNFRECVVDFYPLTQAYAFYRGAIHVPQDEASDWIARARENGTLSVEHRDWGEVIYTAGSQSMKRISILQKCILKICKNAKYRYIPLLILRLLATVHDASEADALDYILSNLELRQTARFLQFLMRDGIFHKDLADVAIKRDPAAAACAAISHRVALLCHHSYPAERTKQELGTVTQLYLAPVWNTAAVEPVLTSVVRHCTAYVSLIYALEYKALWGVDHVNVLMNTLFLTEFPPRRLLRANTEALCATLYTSRHSSGNCLCSHRDELFSHVI